MAVYMKLVNQQLIKNTNLKLLYNSVFHHRGISRAALARQTGLSRTAVSALVDELVETGFLLDSGSGEQEEPSCAAGRKAGRKPNCLEPRSGTHYVLVFGWEEYAVYAHLADISGASSDRCSLPRSPSDSYIRLCREHLNQLFLSGLCREQLLGICFVLPAMIDPATRAVFSTAISLEADGGEHGILSLLRESFPGHAVAVLNDTACAAYAEKVYTSIREKDYAFIRFSRGIGAALFIQDRLLGGACASHTQFGHFSVSPDGPPCACGNRGCLEVMLREDTLAERFPGKGPPVDYESLGQAALYKDADAIHIIRNMAEEFAVALANLICLVHPSLIVLGGRIRLLGPLFPEEVLKSLHEKSFHRMTETVQIRYSLLDAQACLNGAMKYFFDQHYQFTTDMSNTFFIG